MEKDNDHPNYIPLGGKLLEITINDLSNWLVGKIEEISKSDDFNSKGSSLPIRPSLRSDGSTGEPLLSQSESSRPSGSNLNPIETESDQIN